MKTVPTVRIGRPWLFSRRPLPTPASPIQIDPGERVVWSGSCRPRPAMFALQAVATVIPLAVGLVSRSWGPLGISAGLLGTWLLVDRVRVTVGPFGVRASMGVFGFPRVTLAVTEIVQASVIDIRPSQWGGWGYRGSLRALRRAAMILRSGTGIRVDLTGGRVFVVSVDDAATGAAVLQGAIEADRTVGHRSTPDKQPRLIGDVDLRDDFRDRHTD